MLTQRFMKASKHDDRLRTEDMGEHPIGPKPHGPTSPKRWNPLNRGGKGVWGPIEGPPVTATPKAAVGLSSNRITVYFSLFNNLSILF